MACAIWVQNLVRSLPVGAYLYWQETVALGRNRFLWYGLAAVFAFLLVLLLGPGLHAGSLEGFLFVVYLVVPVGLAPLAASRIAAPRASRFVHAVFTAPVRRSTYFLAKLGALLTAAAAYFLLTAPFLALHWVHSGIPAVYSDYVVAGVLLSLFAIAFGLLLGVLFTGRSLAAPVTLSLLPFLLILGYPFLDEAMQIEEPEGEEVPPAPRIDEDPAPVWKVFGFRAIHIAPHLGIMEALNVPPMDVLSTAPAQALLLLTVSIIGLGLIGAWIYLKHQGVEFWTDTRRARTAAIFVAFIILALPALGPAMSYTVHDRGYRVSNFGSGVVGDGMLVEEGSPRPDELYWGLSDTVRIGETRNFDLHLRYSPLPGTELVSAVVQVYGALGLHAAAAEPTHVDFEGLAPNARGDVEVVLPIEAGAERGEGLRGTRYELHIVSNTTLIRLEGEEAGAEETVEEDVFFRVDGEVRGAVILALLFAAPVPLLLLGTGIARDIRRR